MLREWQVKILCWSLLAHLIFCKRRHYEKLVEYNSNNNFSIENSLVISIISYVFIYQLIFSSIDEVIKDPWLTIAFPKGSFILNFHKGRKEYFFYDVSSKKSHETQEKSPGISSMYSWTASNYSLICFSSKHYE